jgi:AcrR family transcriptional regulator
VTRVTSDSTHLWSLLWDEAEPRRRQGLTARRIVEAGIAVADAEGLDAVSMRRIATELDAGAMSLYRHVAGKTELLQAMVDRVNAESPDLDAVPGDWRTKLTVAAHEEFELSHRHPWVLDVPWTRGPLGPHSMTAFDGALRAMRGTGLSPAERSRSVSAVMRYVRGAAREAVAVSTAEQTSGVTEAQWWAGQVGELQRRVTPERFPDLVEATLAGGPSPDPRDDFAFGLGCLLDGIAALVDARR